MHILETIERLQSLLLRSYTFRVYHNVIHPNPILLLVHHNKEEYHHKCIYIYIYTLILPCHHNMVQIWVPNFSSMVDTKEADLSLWSPRSFMFTHTQYVMLSCGFHPMPSAPFAVMVGLWSPAPSLSTWSPSGCTYPLVMTNIAIENGMFNGKIH